MYQGRTVSECVSTCDHKNLEVLQQSVSHWRSIFGIFSVVCLKMLLSFGINLIHINHRIGNYLIVCLWFMVLYISNEVSPVLNRNLNYGPLCQLFLIKVLAPVSVTGTHLQMSAKMPTWLLSNHNTIHGFTFSKMCLSSISFISTCYHSSVCLVLPVTVSRICLLGEVGQCGLPLATSEHNV